jgi:hypothetical protein
MAARRENAAYHTLAAGADTGAAALLRQAAARDVVACSSGRVDWPCSAWRRIGVLVEATRMTCVALR